MKKSDSEKFWNKLQGMSNHQGVIKLSDLALEVGLQPEETLNFLRQVFPLEAGVEVYFQDNDYWIDINNQSLQYMLPVSPSEWIKLNSILCNLPQTDDSDIKSLKNKMTENSPLKVVMELLNQLEKWDTELTELQKSFVKQIENSILETKLLSVTTKDDRMYSVHPCKVLHLEGELSLVGEDSQDHCLFVLSLKTLMKVETVQSTSKPRVSAFEVEEFITAIRAMNESEMRLILKIHDPQAANLFPDHHFLGKPCMVTNPNGDLIWAAYVEPCDDLYDWLMSLGRKVEILDPTNFKKQYLDYCEEKIRKIA